MIIHALRIKYGDDTKDNKVVTTEYYPLCKNSSPKEGNTFQDSLVTCPECKRLLEESRTVVITTTSTEAL